MQLPSRLQFCLELIMSVVNFDFSVSGSDSLGKQLKHSDVPFYY